MDLPTIKFADYAYTWNRPCKPPKITFTSPTSH